MVREDEIEWVSADQSDMGGVKLVLDVGSSYTDRYNWKDCRIVPKCSLLRNAGCLRRRVPGILV